MFCILHYLHDIRIEFIAEKDETTSKRSIFSDSPFIGPNDIAMRKTKTGKVQRLFYAHEQHYLKLEGKR